jgi:hypothetical protein
MGDPWGVSSRSALVRARGPVAQAWLCGVIAALTCACEAVDDSSVSTEIVPLAEGEYHGARWGGTQVERFYTVAWNGPPSAPDGSAVIVSAEHEKPCNLGTSVSRYTSIRPQTASKYVIGSPSPARVILLEDVDEQGFGTLSFADIDCKRIDLSVPDVHKDMLTYVYEPDQTSQKIAVRNRTGAIIFVDPWAQEQHQVTENATAFKVFESGEWLIENHELVKRDLDGKEVSRRGRDVAGLLLLNGRGDLAYQEARGIYTIRAGETKRIAKDGCLYLGNLESFMPSAIGHFDLPCDKTSKLKVTVGTDKTYTYAANIQALTISAGLMIYTTVENEMTKLWIVDAGDPMKIKPAGEFPSFVLEGVMTLPSRMTVVISREDRMNEDGTITRLRTIWQVQRTGDNISLLPLTSGLRNWARAETAIALLYDSGELVLADGALDRVVLRLQNAFNSQFTFIMGGKALGMAYRDDVDPETGLGSLQLHLLNGSHYTLAPDVREFEYVFWPERGLAYVAGGKDPGIRFARIDVPCEASSDAPWACGF